MRKIKVDKENRTISIDGKKITIDWYEKSEKYLEALHNNITFKEEMIELVIGFMEKQFTLTEEEKNFVQSELEKC